ncbi:Flp pilus assembly complex ATPase component TadA [Candidatus Woesearchaeota archaeon]|nr:Flp pilus assembly complex ATPase component TadA [Candidatus Woesearchaeota archaeon]
MNEIEPLMRDFFIEDIQCNGVNTPLYLVHRKYRNLRTNIVFNDLRKLTSFVEKLAQKCGQYVSYANPLLDAALPDGSRANATYTQDVTSRGPTFTIRKFTKIPWTPTQLIQMGTISPEILAYMWMVIESQGNFLVIGGTGSGKCVVGSTPVYLSDGTIKNIKELVEEKFKITKVKNHDDWEYVDGDGTEILSLDKNKLKVIKAKIDKFWRHKAPKKLIKIKTRSGREIITTPEHPFFTFKEGGIVKIRADKIKQKERIAVPRTLPIECKPKVEILGEHLKNRTDVYVCNAFDKITKALHLLKTKSNKNEKQIAEELGIKAKTLSCWKNENAIPLKYYHNIL